MTERWFDVHLRGAFHVTQPAWLVMREQGYGRIVRQPPAPPVCSAIFGQANYGAAKMGLVRAHPPCWPSRARSTTSRPTPSPRWRSPRMTETLLGSLGEKLQPQLVSPLVAYLAHDECPVTGQLFSVGGGRVHRCSSARPRATSTADLTMEAVRDNWDTITDREGYGVPQNLAEETAMFLPFLK